MGCSASRGAQGQIVNLPLRGGSGGRAMREVYEGSVFPALTEWEPELLLISAGFDAHADDPLAGLEWQAEDFRWLTDRLRLPNL
jgi:acetoin utilization deacetylase AcuC-like enzyme